jgi:hypothetical protein
MSRMCCSRRLNHLPSAIIVTVQPGVLPGLDNASPIELINNLSSSPFTTRIFVFSRVSFTNHGRPVVSALTEVIDASEQRPNSDRYKFSKHIHSETQAAAYHYHGRAGSRR